MHVLDLTANRVSCILVLGDFFDVLEFNLIIEYSFTGVKLGQVCVNDETNCPMW